MVMGHHHDREAGIRQPPFQQRADQVVGIDECDDGLALQTDASAWLSAASAVHIHWAAPGRRPCANSIADGDNGHVGRPAARRRRPLGSTTLPYGLCRKIGELRLAAGQPVP
ncbi:MAG: hypothetical protein KDH18_25205, partial [Rhodoferax sp.]|nr:hypothetical protein [Rhodoferax sp.]